MDEVQVTMQRPNNNLNLKLIKQLFNSIKGVDKLANIFGHDLTDCDWILRHDIKDSNVYPYIMALDGVNTTICENVLKLYANEEVTIFTRGSELFFLSTEREREERDLHTNINYK